MKKILFIVYLVIGIGIITITSFRDPSTTSDFACYSVEVGETSLDNTLSKQLRVSCPSGTKALGAGWSVLDATNAILDGEATYFQPSFDGSDWLVNAKNNSQFSPEWKLRVRVTCSCIDQM